MTVSIEGLADGPLDDVEVLLRGFLSAEAFDRLLARAPRLAWVHSASAGVERVLTPAGRERGLVVTNARGVFSEPIAEYVLMMILAVSRRLPQLLELQRERTWQPLEGTELRDVTIGIVGLGSIGRAVAELATRVRLPRHRDPPPARRPRRGSRRIGRIDRLTGPEGLPELLAESDFIVLAAPLTPETEGLIDEAALGRGQARRVAHQRRPRPARRRAGAPPGAPRRAARRGRPRHVPRRAAAARLAVLRPA